MITNSALLLGQYIMNNPNGKVLLVKGGKYYEIRCKQIKQRIVKESPGPIVWIDDHPKYTDV